MKNPLPMLLKKIPLFSLTKRHQIHRWSLIIGNLLEHFDSYLYAFLTPVIGKVFFPQFTPLYQIILAFSVYLITFIARPLGGLFFSKLTYRSNALKVLSWSLMGVALSTGLMGLIPSEEHIGFLAPLLLVVVRFIQSFCSAGESAIAGYYLMDTVEDKKQMYWSGLYQCSTILGIMLASYVSSYVLLSENSQEIWRIPFFIGFFLGIWALWMRFHYEDVSTKMDPCFSMSYKGLVQHLRKNSKLVLSLVPIYGFSYITYSIPFVFLNPYLSQTTEIPLESLIEQVNSLFWIDALLLPFVAKVMNRINFTSGLLWSAFLFMIGSSLLFLNLTVLSSTSLYLFRLILVIAGIGFCVALFPWTNRLYPPKDKYLFHSVSYNLGSEIFGRSTPFICFSLYAMTGNSASPLIYILSLSGIALGLVLWLMTQKSIVQQGVNS